MSVVSSVPATPVTHKRQLVSWLETGGRTPDRWRIGTEHEKFLFDRETLRPLPYEGESGIKALMEELQAFKWQPVMEGETLIGLKRNDEAISLEPGGQFELSGAPLLNLHETAMEFHHHLDEVSSVGRVLGFAAMGMGFQPKWTRDDMPWMPKGRYKIMREYMPKVGTLGLDMMKRSCTVQVNLDFADEADMVRKMQVSLALQPIVGALFATSPFKEGVPTGDHSYRNRIWQDTDNQRSGPLDFAFTSFGFEQYVDWALQVPMYFVYRNGGYIDVSGASFLDFMNGKLEQLPGEVATMADWADHLTTLFPMVRLKRYIEMRGADMGDAEMAMALPALWTGLLYDSVSLDQAAQLVREWTAPERAYMYLHSPRLGIRDEIKPGRSLRAVAADMVKIASQGLKRRAIASYSGGDESIYLQPLHNILDYGVTHAEDMLRRYFDEWDRDINRVFAHARIA